MLPHSLFLFFLFSCSVGSTTGGLDPITDANNNKTYSLRVSLASTADCNFPQHWNGNWFQSGLQIISIKGTTINTKGRCKQQDGEKYLLHHEKDNCLRCVVFHEKHLNVLQYKESFCVPETAVSIARLCSTITADANLFAMFRLDASPIECPFKAPMTFVYDRGQGECRNPVSSVDSCIDSSRLLFNYQACPDVPGTESSAEELQCLATWKEGSSRYLVGLMQYRHHAAYEERFRCFVYEKVKKGGNMMGPYSNNLFIRSAPLTLNYLHNSTAPQTAELINSNILFRISQSGDATCNGLTPYEGSKTLMLRKALPIKQCTFPLWLSPRSWHTLDGHSVLHLNSSNMKLVNGSNTLLTTCSQVVDNQNQDEVTVLLHITTNQCLNGYICCRIVRRDMNILEMQMGLVTRQAEDACHSSNFNKYQIPYTTFTSSVIMKKQCPSLGHFGITSLTQEGRSVRESCGKGNKLSTHSLSVGCSRRNTLELRVTCKNKEEPQQLLLSEYSCHGWWEENGLNYLITSPISSSSRKFCFIYRDISSSTTRLLQFSSIAGSCRRDVSPGTEGVLAFNGTSKGDCGDITLGSSSLKPVTGLRITSVTILFSFISRVGRGL